MTPPAQTQETWTTRRLLAWIADALQKRGLESPRLSAEILVTHVLGCERLALYTDADRPAAPEERERLRDLVRRALGHEPIQYLTGGAWFFGLQLRADRRALIPRPSTETIVEQVLQTERQAARGRPVRIADVCTGSGCIAIALAKHLRDAEIVASDLSPEALALASENVERTGVAARVRLVKGSLLEPLAGLGPFDWVVSNPPYIPDHEWGEVAPNVKDHEPHLALRGGADGMDLVGPVIAGAIGVLAPGGRLLVEIASCTAGRCVEAAGAAGLAGVRVLKDHEGLDRVLVGDRPS